MRRAARRAGIAVLVLLVGLPLAAVAGGDALLDSAPVRARIVAAVQRATGHTLRLDGPLQIDWSFTPAIEADHVALLNPPGYSRHDFASVDRLIARVALLPLLAGRVDVRSLVLDRPDVLLERNAAGRGNWVVSPPPQAATPGPAGPPHARTPVLVQALGVHHGRIAWGGAPPLSIAALYVAPAGGPITGSVAVRGVTFKLGGRYQPDGSSALTAVGGGLALSFSGQAGGPVAVEALAPDLAALQTLASQPLPPLRQVQASLTLGPAGPTLMHVTAGPSDLGAIEPGLHLQRLDATAAGPGEPVKLVAEGALRALPFAVALNLGSLAAVLGGATPIPIQALLKAGGATLSAQGSVPGRSLQGLVATVSVGVPDMRRTGALAGLALPALHDVVLGARLAPLASGGVSIRQLKLTAREGDAAGDLAFGTAPRPSLRGSLLSRHLDIDAMLAAASPMPVPRRHPQPPHP